MATYKIQLANGTLIGTYTSIAKRDEAIKADVAAKGNRGPYIDVARKEQITVTLLYQLKIGGYGGQVQPPTTTPATDQLAPTVPRDVIAAPGVGNIRWSWDQSTDWFDGIIPASGINKYQIEIDSNATLIDVAKPTGGANAFDYGTLYNIGAMSPAPTVTKSGNNITLTAAGTGIDGTADQCAFYADDVTGDFMYAIKMATFTGSGINTYAESGVMVRGDATPGSVYFALHIIWSDGRLDIQAKRRSAANGNASSVVLADSSTVVFGNSTPRDLMLKRLGTLLYLGYVDAAGAWNDLVTPVDAAFLPSSVKRGSFLSSFAAGVVATSQHQEVNASNGARVEYLQTTTSSNRTARIRAVDVNGNISAFTSLVTATPIAAPSGSAIKWHPGVYGYYSSPGWQTFNDSHVNDVLAFLDSIASEPTIRGVQLTPMWAGVEGATQGDYTNGKKQLDKILAKCNALGKYLMLQINAGYIGGIGNYNQLFPQYIITNYGVTLGYKPAPPEQVYARTWQTATMDRLIALHQWLGTTYNGHPNFEMIALGESAVPITDGKDGFSNRNLLDQTKRLLTALRASFPNTNVRMGANDLDPENLMVEEINHVATIWGLVGGPDVWPENVTQADAVFVGKSCPTGNNVYTDQRDRLGWCIEMQSPELIDNRFTFAQLYNATMFGYTPSAPNGRGSFAMPSMRPKYIVPYVMGFSSVSGNNWPGIVTFIRSVNGKVYENPVGTVPYPTLFPNGIQT